MTTTTVVRALGDLAHDGVHPRTAACDCAPAQVLADRADGTVVRRGGIVAKAHAPDTDGPALAARLALAATPALAGILLPPLPAPRAEGPSSTTGPGPVGPHRPHRPAADHAPTNAGQPPEHRPSGQDPSRTAPSPPGPLPGPSQTVLEGRPVTLWPHGSPVDPSDPDAAPWEEAAVLLARLHGTRPPLPLPPMRGPLKAALAVARMCAARPGDPATHAVLAAWRRLPPWARDETPAPAHRAGLLCHGDLHLGQLVRHPAPHGPWLLIDVDDAGLGDAAWDLARPAAWYAAGLLPPDIWHRFLDAYRRAGGPAVRAEGDPWPDLDVPARALTVQTAALAFAKSAAEGRSPDEVEQMMIDACARIASLPPELAVQRSS
ncbi:aminoglycoside phosphotransferase family protein [Streptomyces sp. NPDC048560]|uniref:phosphotransferase family protein n=1 Tax=Streptomyces sp. NPDC048560 TaxID=3155488 RepID=UPI0034306CA1